MHQSAAGTLWKEWKTILMPFTFKYACLLCFSDTQFKNFLINVKREASTQVKSLPQAETVNKHPPGEALKGLPASRTCSKALR